MNREYPPPATGLGGLLLGEVLGTGGSGSTVYAATDRVTGAPLAVKVLRGLDQGARRRLLGEAAVAARVSHPGLVAVLDSGESDDAIWLVLERINGLDLQREVEQHGPLDPPEALALLTQVARALAALHTAGIAHRDITPSNVLVEGAPGARRARLTDAGLAGALVGTDEEAGRLSVDSAWASSCDGAGLVDVSGTAAWMPPEQWRGANPSAAGDVYSAGAVLHWLLTGKRPFSGTTLPQLAAAHALGARPVPSAARAGLAPLYDALVARLTAVEPSERPADGAALVALLEDVVHGRVVMPPPASPAQGRADGTHGGIVASATAAAGDAGLVTSGDVATPPGDAPRRAALSGRRARWPLPVALTIGLVVALVATVMLLRGDDNESAAPVTREVCAREVTLRDQPVKGSTQLATVQRGSTVAVVGTRGAWSQVKRDDGGEAWVVTEFLCP